LKQSSRGSGRMRRGPEGLRVTPEKGYMKKRHTDPATRSGGGGKKSGKKNDVFLQQHGSSTLKRPKYSARRRDPAARSKRNVAREKATVRRSLKRNEKHEIVRETRSNPKKEGGAGRKKYAKEGGNPSPSCPDPEDKPIKALPIYL